MATPQWENDTRGWILCVVSGIACVFGASIICIDILVRRLPGKLRNFRIEESNAFLAASLSLSFGVMLFSALYSILPSSKQYLISGGYSPSVAAWILVACFMCGFLGIQVVSRFLHQHIPSHVVDCDHNHGESTPYDHLHSHTGTHSHSHSRRSSHPPVETNGNDRVTETTMLLVPGENGEAHPPHSSDTTTLVSNRRPSMVFVKKRVMSFVKDTKTNCDASGPCHGYSDPCGQECFKHVGAKYTPVSRRASRCPAVLRTTTRSFYPPEAAEVTPIRVTRAQSQDPIDVACESDEESEAQHHHHVPENAFLSIGLQTSIAIAVHKLPEGFITYATNHASPALGFSVFMALFIHNITEGFALALPLYLAFGSRVKAMLWASLLGGVSQPLGAGFAAVWFKLAGRTDHKPGSAVYGGMFAVTAGMMTSVALVLFFESLSLNHNRNLCITFAFMGMAIMGVSNALTAS